MFFIYLWYFRYIYKQATTCINIYIYITKKTFTCVLLCNISVQNYINFLFCICMLVLHATNFKLVHFTSYFNFIVIFETTFHLVFFKFHLNILQRLYTKIILKHLFWSQTIFGNWKPFKMMKYVYYFTLRLVSAIFLSNFYFFIKWWTFKNYEKCVLFHLKSFCHSWDIQTFVIFSLPFHTFQIQKGRWKLNNLWCHKLACINLQM